MGEKSEIIFYGERGIVNGIILDIMQESKENPEKPAEFLKCIKKFNSNENIFERNTKFEKITFFIEISLSEFGDPDLVVVAKEGKHNHILFFEAKTTSFVDNAFEIGSKKLEGIRSLINVQLGLKYRFAKAIDAYPKKTDISDTIEEKPGSGEIWLGEEKNQKPRRLKKQSLVSLCKDKFRVENRKFYFISLTGDPCTCSEALGIGDKYLPLVSKLNESCNVIENNRQEFEEISKKYTFGNLTYQQLIEREVIKSDGHYGQAAKLTLNEDEVTLSAFSFSEQTSKQVLFIDDIANEIEKSKQIKIEKLNGSYSLKKDKDILVKILCNKTKDNSIYIGVDSDVKSNKPKGALSLGKGKFHSKQFTWYELGFNDENDNDRDMVVNYLDEILMPKNPEKENVKNK